MNKKSLVLIAVLVSMVAIGGYIYTNRNARQQAANSDQEKKIQQPLTTASVMETVVINMDEYGFMPNMITIKKNTKVIFRNMATEAHWPASNIHPTHGIYPEFDPQRPIPPGASWSFTFNKVGIWRMHDHLLPRILGTITVTE